MLNLALTYFFLFQPFSFSFVQRKESKVNSRLMQESQEDPDLFDLDAPPLFSPHVYVAERGEKVLLHALALRS